MSLQDKFFHIAGRNFRESEKELNIFLRSHRVVTIYHEFVADKDNYTGALSPEFMIDSPENEQQSTGRTGKKRIRTSNECLRRKRTGIENVLRPKGRGIKPKLRNKKYLIIVADNGIKVTP